MKTAELKGATGCQLSNSELIKSLREWSSKLCSTGGKAWSLQVPVNLNKDPDILIEEMCQRLSAMESYASQSLPQPETSAGQIASDAWDAATEFARNHYDRIYGSDEPLSKEEYLKTIK